MIAPEFLDLEEVLEIHALQLDEFGGIAGVRDPGLLESAVEQPRVSLERDDERLYELTMDAAEGRADKTQIAAQLRKLADEAQA
jgi:prophage maintenance system killer protein